MYLLLDCNELIGCVEKNSEAYAKLCKQSQNKPFLHMSKLSKFVIEPSKGYTKTTNRSVVQATLYWADQNAIQKSYLSLYIAEEDIGRFVEMIRKNFMAEGILAIHEMVKESGIVLYGFDVFTLLA